MDRICFHPDTEIALEDSRDGFEEADGILKQNWSFANICGEISFGKSNIFAPVLLQIAADTDVCCERRWIVNQ